MSTDKSERTILFLCSGNYYRSRFAELGFNWLAERARLPWRARSRGLRLNPVNAGPISPHALRALRRLGIPSPESPRFPALVEEADLWDADHVVALKEVEHRPLLEARFPDAASRVEYWDIHDVDVCDPEEAIPQLTSRLEELTARLRLQR